MRIKNRNTYKWEVLALLWIAFFLNQADRQVFNVLIPLIRKELQLTDFQIGLIGTGFNLVYALCVPIAGFVADAASKRWVIIVSIFIWSIATILTGVSTGLLALILTRSLATGGGEAFFGPANYTLLANYHKPTRAFAMSIHQTAYYLGIILCGYLAGHIAEYFGWRQTFYLFGAVGVVHAIVLAFRLQNGEDNGQVRTSQADFWAGLRLLFKTPTALLLTIGFSGLIFVLVGYLTWMPTFLYEKFHIALASAGFASMFYAHLFAFVGVIIAGKISDKLAKKRPASRLLMQGLGLICAAPFIVAMGYSPTLTGVYIGLAGFGFARAFFDANTYSVLYDVIPPKFQATASGIMLMTGFGVGSLSPLILGYIKPMIGLSEGIAYLSVVWIVCGVLLIYAYRFTFEKDRLKNVQN